MRIGYVRQLCTRTLRYRSVYENTMQKSPYVKKGQQAHISSMTSMVVWARVRIFERAGSKRKIAYWPSGWQPSFVQGLGSEKNRQPSRTKNKRETQTTRWRVMNVKRQSLLWASCWSSSRSTFTGDYATHVAMSTSDVVIAVKSAKFHLVHTASMHFTQSYGPALMIATTSDAPNKQRKLQAP